jgi:hypothetical protein
VLFADFMIIPFFSFIAYGIQKEQFENHLEKLVISIERN